MRLSSRASKKGCCCKAIYTLPIDSPVVILHASEQHVQLLVRESSLGIEESEALLRDLALVRRWLRVTAQASADTKVSGAT